jgi:hypothetical protein
LFLPCRFIHVQVNLAALRTPDANVTVSQPPVQDKAPANNANRLALASTAASASPTGDKDKPEQTLVDCPKKASTLPPAGVATSFDTIEIRDIGNMGFRLVLDSINLISTDAVSAADSPILPVSPVVPVLGDDLVELKASPNRYLMKLKAQATLADVKTICDELASSAATKRFAGACLTRMDMVSAWYTYLRSGQQLGCQPIIGVESTVDRRTVDQLLPRTGIALLS